MLTGKKILITGGHGFLGRYVLDRLQQRNSVNISTPRSSVCDLREQTDVRALFHSQQPNVVIHLAATVGGIQFNQQNPATCLYDNLMMGLNVLHESQRAKVEKVVLVGTTCSYPKHAKFGPFKEDELWDGYPEETNAPYGLAKRILVEQCRVYRQQHGLNAISLIPANLYGPGDNFDPQSSHVIPALISKFETGEPVTTVWGTGRVTREFLHVRDAARGIVMATECYDEPEPVNLGTGREIGIRGLAELIARLMKYEGELTFDHSQPDGQPRRRLDVSRAKSFGFEAEIRLEEGLKETIDWYLDPNTWL